MAFQARARREAMPAFRPLLLIALYAVGAALLAALLAAFTPQVGWPQAIALAGAAALAVGLLHETAARRAAQRRLEGATARLSRDQRALYDELQGARRELQGLFEALEAHEGTAGAIGVAEVKAEVRVLKSLVERLSAGRTGSAALPMPAPAEADGAGETAPAAAAAPDETEVLEALRESLREDRIEVVLQPIVSLPQRKRRYYECFTRIRGADGSLMPAEHYIALAEREGLVTAVDNMLLFRCVQLVRRIQRQNADRDFFCNLSPRSLGDAAFFSDFVAFLEDNPELTSGLIFEFTQADYETLPPEAAGHLDRLRRLGCRFSIDQVRDLDVDPVELRDQRVRFLKVEAGLLYARMEAEGDDAVRQWKRDLDRRAVDLIVEKIEDEAMLIELLDLQIDFGQGYLFGEPRLARPEDDSKAA